MQLQGETGKKKAFKSILSWKAAKIAEVHRTKHVYKVLFLHWFSLLLFPVCSHVGHTLRSLGTLQPLNRDTLTENRATQVIVSSLSLIEMDTDSMKKLWQM